MTQTPSEIAKMLKDAGVPAPYASMLANGQRTPSLKLAVEIEEKTGIAPSFWINRDQASQMSGQGATTIGAPDCGEVRA